MRRHVLFVVCCLVLVYAALEMCRASLALPATTQIEAVRELSRTGGFSYPVSVSADPSDGSCWVADMDNHQVVHLAQDGITELSRASGFHSPASVSVNPSDGSCWVADSGNDQVVHLAADGVTELSRAGGFCCPWSVSVNSNDGSCWVADSENNQVVHLASDGITELSRAGFFSYPVSVSVNPSDGSCWAAIRGWGWVVHLASDGTTVLSRAGGFYGLESVSADPSDGSCWVLDSGHDQVVHLAPDGTTELSRAGGFSYPVRVSVDPSDGSCWVTDTSNNQVVHLAPDGVTEMSRTGGFFHPVSVSANPSDGSCWVADTGNNQVVHLGLGSEGPAIRHVTLCRSRWVDSAGTDFYSERARIRVIDFDGWEDVSVTTVDPEGVVHPGPADVCDGSWNEGLYILSQGWGQDTPEPLVEGAFTVTAEDSLGRTDVLETAAIAVPPPVQDITYPLNGDVIWETVPTFSWELAEGAPVASELCICVTDEGPEPFVAWVKPGMPGDATSVTYNDDDSAAGELTPGHRYMVHLRAWYPDEDPSELVSATSFTQRDIDFWVYSPVPVIEYMWIGRGRDTSPEGTVSYHERMVARVRDMDDDIASAVITDSQGDPHDAYFRSDLGDWRWEIYEEESSSPAGAYTLTVTDAQGYTATLSVQTSEIPDTTAVIATPPANYSIASSTPVFSWSGPAEVCYCLGVYEVDGPCAIWCGGRYVSDPEVSALYNDDGNAAQPELTPGRLYGWYATAMLPDPVEQSDPRCVSEFNPIASGYFWVEPKFLGLLQPINADGSSVFKLRSTVPVKFRLLNADGSYKSDAIATLKVAFVDSGVVGGYYEALSTAAPDSGNTFRYDPADNQYIFNLGTKGLDTGTWSLQVTVNDIVVKQVLISLK